MTAIDTPNATDLVGLSASEMARRVALGQLSSQHLVEAHIERIEQVNPRLNAVVSRRYDRARAEARAIDQARAAGEKLGPLGGVPITVKECFHLAGAASTAGVGRFANEILDQDGPLVARLRAAGAIVLAQTNVPQLMMMHETDGPLHGRANNPWDLDRAPGGSSGGEAAIIAAGGSPLGLGSDIGGSIRQPAHSCGICGLKPTTLRLTNAGARGMLQGLEAMRSQAGPLARGVEDLVLALRVLVEGNSEWIDPQIAPVPLGNPDEVRIEGLRIGYWTDDGFFPPSPAVRRAVNEAAQALARRGARVEPFQPPDIARAVQLYFGLLSADGAAAAVRMLEESPRDWRIERLVMLGKYPRFLRAGWCAMLRAQGQHRTAMVLESSGRRTADEYWELCKARGEYAERFFAAWSASRFDALLCPPHALPALKHGKSGRLSVAASYCYWANLLGVPAGVVPITRVRADEESDRPESRDKVDQSARAVEKGSAGLPIGVQVAARPWHEHVALAVMQALEDDFRGRGDYPRTPV